MSFYDYTFGLCIPPLECMFAAKCLVNMARGRYNYRQPSYTVKNFEMQALANSCA